jgi:hypothetical protein
MQLAVFINSNVTYPCVDIQNGGLIEIGNGATFTWSGNGYLKVNNDPNQPGKVNVRVIT